MVLVCACGLAASDYDDYRRAVAYYNSAEYANTTLMADFSREMGERPDSSRTLNQTQRKNAYKRKLLEQRDQERKVRDLLTNMGYGYLYEQRDQSDPAFGGGIQNDSLRVLPQQGPQFSAVEG
jgi:hypothetical protein